MSYPPHISVIVPAYNAQKTIGKCIASLLTQTLEELEIIVINDGSTDKTLDVLKKYTHDKRLHVITQENGGVSRARNHGIAIAQGKYLAFVDADDYVEKNMYEKLLETAEGKADGFDVVCCGYKRHFLRFSRKVLPILSIPLNDKTLVENKLLLPVMEAKNQDMDAIQECWSKLYRRNMLLEHNDCRFPEDMQFGEDITFIAKVFAIASSVAFVNEPLYHYRRFLTARTLSTKPRLDGYIQTVKWRGYLKEIANRFPANSPIYKSQQTTPGGKIARAERFTVSILQENTADCPHVESALKDIFLDKTYREGILTHKELTGERVSQRTAVQREDFSLWLKEMATLAKSSPTVRRSLTERLRVLVRHFIK